MARPTAAQRNVRKIFRASCDCFNNQRDDDGVVPPALGARNKSWWYDEASASNFLWVWKGKDIKWGGAPQPMLKFKYLRYERRNASAMFLRETLSFLSIFLETRTWIQFDDTYELYEGRDPWFAGRDPDEVALLCWKIIALRTELGLGVDRDIILPPGESIVSTSNNAVSLAILYFCFTWTALLHTGKSHSWVIGHMACVLLSTSELQNAFTWWKASTENTHVVRPWIPYEDIPATIELAPPFTNWKGRDLLTRFNFVGCHDPWIKPPPPSNPARYRNFFMKKTLDKYHADEVPDWCVEQPTDDSWVTSEFPDYAPHDTQDARDRLRVAAWPLGGTRMRAFIRLPAGKQLKYLWVYASSGHKVGAEPWRQVGCYKTQTDDWDEATLTWNNQPALDILLYKTFILVAGWYRFPINEEHSFCLKFVDEYLPAGSTQEIYFTTKDNADTEHRPYLQY